jgi:hypothetical protein
MIDLSKNYIVKGGHEVISISHDDKHAGTFFEYLVVWRHYLTNELFVARVNAKGMTFGQGQFLIEAG